MTAIVVYYSLEGSTELVAGKIAERLGCDSLRIETRKKYVTKGFMKFVHAGGDAFMNRKPSLMPYSFDGSKYDTVIFATPVWAGSFVPAFRTFIDENAEALKGMHFSLYTGFLGGGADDAAKRLARYLDIGEFENHLVLLDPIKKPRDDNDRKIEDFCRKVQGGSLCL